MSKEKFANEKGGLHADFQKSEKARREKGGQKKYHGAHRLLDKRRLGKGYEFRSDSRSERRSNGEENGSPPIGNAIQERIRGKTEKADGRLGKGFYGDGPFRQNPYRHLSSRYERSETSPAYRFVESAYEPDKSHPVFRIFHPPVEAKKRADRRDEGGGIAFNDDRVDPDYENGSKERGDGSRDDDSQNVAQIRVFGKGKIRVPVFVVENSGNKTRHPLAQEHCGDGGFRSEENQQNR